MEEGGRGWKRRESESFSLFEKKKNKNKKRERGEAKGERNQILLAYILCPPNLAQNGEKPLMLTFLRKYIF